jgi:hypothetical protein
MRSFAPLRTTGKRIYFDDSALIPVILSAAKDLLAVANGTPFEAA